MNYSERYLQTRARTESICYPLKTEDYVVQPIEDVSPPKWHLGHTTWFFETFILKPFLPGYNEYDVNYNYVFNSYYETIGSRVIRTDRGNLSRPSVEDIYNYRKHVDNAMLQLLQTSISEKIKELVLLGFNHEEQHQELLFTDIKYILGHNPLFPKYSEDAELGLKIPSGKNSMATIQEGIYEIGHKGDGFCFDNELGRHKYHLQGFHIAKDLVTNGEFLDFLNDGGYTSHQYWHAEGLNWVKTNNIQAPLYWHKIEGAWYHYTLGGLKPIPMDEALCHISFYEAAAYAAWKGMRLPTEFEWEVAASTFEWGHRWEWTNSAYLPYPGFMRAPGAVGEYNGKFMINQMVLRGASECTSPAHSRASYRNFFHPHLRWQFTGIRLAL
jgi:ergothioneine biosynthesis protein EgtB